MMRINLTVPLALKKEMQKHEEINWSAVATKSFERFLQNEAVLKAFEELGVTDDEALQRALRVQHGKAVLAEQS
jgi:predicted dinucleotide-binding enzyme